MVIAAIARLSLFRKRYNTGRSLTRAVRSALEIELESELQLALVILTITGRGDFAEAGGRSVVERPGSSNYSVPAKSGWREVRSIRQVKSLCAKFELCSFGKSKLFEEGEIEAAKAGSQELRRRAA